MVATPAVMLAIADERLVVSIEIDMKRMDAIDEVQENCKRARIKVASPAMFVFDIRVAKRPLCRASDCRDEAKSVCCPGDSHEGSKPFAARNNRRSFDGLLRDGIGQTRVS